MGQYCSCEERPQEEVPAELRGQTPQYLDDYLVEQGEKYPAIRSEPVIKTNFDDHAESATHMKGRFNNNVASSSHLKRSIFSKDDGLRESKLSIHDKHSPTGVKTVNPVVVSLRDVFNDSPMSPHKPVNAKPPTVLRLFDPEMEEPVDQRPTDQRFPVIRAMSLKKVSSVESLVQMNNQGDPIPADDNAFSIEVENPNDPPFRNIFISDESKANVQQSNGLQRLLSGKFTHETIPRENKESNANPGSARMVQTPKGKGQPSDDNVRVIHLKNGSVYEGELSHNLPHGKGTESSPNGDHYTGSFSRGLKSGYGKLNLANGNKYRGNFENDKFNGMGTIFFINGDSYIGEFKNDEINGLGTFSHSDGRIDKGFWRNGELVSRHLP
jgi:hypothetical protein